MTTQPDRGCLDRLVFGCILVALGVVAHGHYVDGDLPRATFWLLICLGTFYWLLNIENSFRSGRDHRDVLDRLDSIQQTLSDIKAAVTVRHSI